jgi:hypothetical protein
MFGLLKSYRLTYEDRRDVGVGVDSSLIHIASAGHAYREDTERWATRAEYPQHSDEFRAAVASASRAHPDGVYYIAGGSAFVSSTAAFLKEGGIADANIRQDKYLGYKPAVQWRPPVTSPT